MKAAVPTNDHGVPVLFIADSTTLTLPDHPILVVDLRDSNGRPPFRCLLSELWGVDNNLNIAVRRVGPHLERGHVRSFR